MADFNLNGNLVDTNGDPVRGAHDLRFTVVLSGSGPLGNRNLFQASGTMSTGDNGNFSSNYSIPDEMLQFLTPFIRPTITIGVVPFYPISHRRMARVQQQIRGPLPAMLRTIRAISNGLQPVINQNFDQVLPIRVTVVLEGDTDRLDDLDTMALDLITNRTVTTQPGADTPTIIDDFGPPVTTVQTRKLGSGIARRDGDKYTGMIVCRRSDISANSFWLAMHTGAIRPAANAQIAASALREVFLRTRRINGTQLIQLDGAGDLLAVETSVMLTEISEPVRQDDMQDQLNDSFDGGIAQDVGFGLLIARDLNVDFRDGGTIRVTGRVGHGIGDVDDPFQVAEIGRFQVDIRVSPHEHRTMLPGAETDFSNPVDLDARRSSFDVLPGTDIDEIVPQNVVEDFISDFVADSIVDQFSERIVNKLEDKIDEIFDDREDQLQQAADFRDISLSDLKAEIRDTMFFTASSVDIENNDLTITGAAGFWHELLNLADLADVQCPADTAGAMFPNSRPVRTFRRYQKTLSAKPLAKWMSAYKKHEKELAMLVRKDVSLAARVIRAAADLLPVLSEKGDFSLSEDAVERLQKIAAIAQRQAGPDLAKVIDAASDIFASGKGKALPALIDLAAKHSPPVSKEMPKIPKQAKTAKKTTKRS